MPLNKLPSIPTNIPPISTPWSTLSQVPRAKRIPFVLREYINQPGLKTAGVNRYLLDTVFSVAEATGNPTICRYTAWARSVFSLAELHKVVYRMVKIAPPPARAQQRVDNSFEAVLGRALVANHNFRTVNKEQVSDENFSLDFVLQYGLDVTDAILKKHNFKEVVAVDRCKTDEYGNEEVLFILKHKEAGNCALLFTATMSMSSIGGRSSKCTLYTERVNTTTRNMIIKDFMEAVTDHFCTNLDTTVNYISVQSNGDMMTKQKPDMSNVKVSTFDYEGVRDDIRLSLKDKEKYSVMLIGDPGIGKTVSIYKLMQDLPNTPFIMLSPIHDSDVLERLFQMLRNFESCVVVLDDLEKFDVKTKMSRNTGVLLRQVEGSSSVAAFQGVIISIVNVPRDVDITLRRSKRFGDDCIYVRYPSIDAALETTIKILTEAGHAEALENMDDVRRFVQYMCLDNNTTDAASIEEVMHAESSDSTEVAPVQFSFADIDACVRRFIRMIERPRNAERVAADGYGVFFTEAFKAMCQSILNSDLDVKDGNLCVSAGDDIFARRKRALELSTK